MAFLRNSFFRILYKIGFGNVLLRHNRKQKYIPVLVFHKIIPEYDEIWPGVHPKLFEEIIMMLKKHYEIKPLSALYTSPDPEASLKNCCFITFDDGYKDFLDYAYPILRRLDIPSSLFVLPYQITNKGHIWTSTIVFFIKHYSLGEVDEFFGQRAISISAGSRYNAFKLNLDITVQLCAMLQADRMKIIDDLRQKFVDDNRIIENELLSFEELRILSPGIVTVASHSLTHPSFQNETDLGLIETELRESKEIIEFETKQKVNAFAFPFATYNELSLNAVKRIYKMAFTRINHFVSLKKLKNEKEYLFDLPRFNVHHNTPEEVFFLINGFHKRLKG